MYQLLQNLIFLDRCITIQLNSAIIEQFHIIVVVVRLASHTFVLNSILIRLYINSEGVIETHTIFGFFVFSSLKRISFVRLKHSMHLQKKKGTLMYFNFVNFDHTSIVLIIFFSFINYFCSFLLLSQALKILFIH